MSSPTIPIEQTGPAGGEPGRRRGPAFWLQAVLLVVVVATFVLAELGRGHDQVRVTHLSMAGWTLFGVLFLAWLWEDCGPWVGIGRLARLAGLSAIAFAVLYAFYSRSHLLEAGVEIDATYTFMGLGFFVASMNPITFAGRTASFAQFPLALLGHLPSYLVGFDRLGPLAIHMTILLQVAILLAVLTTLTVPGRLVVQAATVAGVTAVFANRLTLLLCNLTGYGIPSVAIGIMFLATTIDAQPFRVTAAWVGGLLMLSLMHHYPGFFFVLPLVGLWVAAGRAPRRRVATFVRANLPLCATVLVAAACVGFHPELLLPRLKAVTVETLPPGEFGVKVRQNWHHVRTTFPAEFVRTFFYESPGSWHLLNIPPLGGWLGPIVVANWIVTAIAMGRRGLVFVARLAALGACLLALTALQHAVTGFENYRDMTLVLGMVIPGLGFVLLAPRVRPAARALLIAYGLAVAAYGYADVAELAGKRYAVLEYAPAQQAELEAVRRFWRSEGGERLRGAVVGAVVADPFPLEYLYRTAALEHQIDLRFVGTTKFCADPAAVVDEILASTCERVGLVVPARACAATRLPPGWPRARASRTALYLFAPSCGQPAPRNAATPEVIDLP